MLTTTLRSHKYRVGGGDKDRADVIVKFRKAMEFWRHLNEDHERD